MGARYAMPGLQTPNTTTFKTMLEMLGGTALRFRFYDFLMGASGSPADNALVYGLRRITASGTGSTVVAEALDPADVTARVICEENATIEPTFAGLNLIEIPMNLRASYRWVAAPGSEVVVAAVANEGLAATSLSSAYTGQTECTCFWEE